jgi:ATP-dependent Lon protease
MLHIVDSTQNSTFSDNYFGQELKIDLSNIWFVFAMNEIPECGPLKDRLFIIHIDGYKHKDKIEIARNFLLKRVCINVGLKETDVIMDNDVTSYFINKITIGENKTNTGVRYIEKALTDFINKIAFIVNTVSTFGDLSFSVEEKLEYPVTVTHKLIDKILVQDNEPVINMMYI